MSRVGQSPVVVPDGVSIEILDGILTAKGKLGAQSLPISGEVNVAIEDNIVTVSPKNQTKRSRSMWGTTRASINNMLRGVNEGFTIDLEINGVGYRPAFLSIRDLLFVPYYFCLAYLLVPFKVSFKI